MLFDKLCGIVERHIKEFQDAINICSLFYFEKDPFEKIRDRNEPPDDDFFLPFPITAVEDPTSCILLVEKSEDEIGLATNRAFIECRLNDHPLIDDMDSVVITKGQVRDIKTILKENDSYFNGNISSQSRIYSKKKGHIKEYDDLINEDEDKRNQICINNVATAMEQINYINNSRSFIVQETPTSIKNKKGKILRSNQRPLYTLLSTNKIHEKMGISISSGTDNSPISHFRRRHFRFLTNDRYSNKGTNKKKIIKNGPRKGQTYYKKVVIPATWVGESEKIVGNKKYKVMINK